MFGNEFTRKLPNRFPLPKPMIFTGVTKTGGPKLTPPLVDFVTTIPLTGANCSQATYISPAGPTAIVDPWLMLADDEMRIGVLNEAPPLVEREKKMGRANGVVPEGGKLVHATYTLPSVAVRELSTAIDSLSWKP